MTDRILSFRFKQTREKITDRGGLAIKVREYTLDIDATLIESDKGDAQKSYAGTVGYHPMLGYLSDGTDHPVCSTVKFRQGNESPQTDILESLKRRAESWHPMASVLSIFVLTALATNRRLSMNVRSVGFDIRLRLILILR